MTHSAAPTCALGSSRSLARSLATPKLHPPVPLTLVISRCLSCLTAVQCSQHALAPQLAAVPLSPVPLSPVPLSRLPLILPRSAQLSRLVGALVALKRRAKEGSCTLLDAAGKLIAKAQVRRLHEPIAIGCGEQSIAPNPNGLRRGRGMEPNRSAFALLWFGSG